jgi:hypothetical protein
MQSREVLLHPRLDLTLLSGRSGALSEYTGEPAQWLMQQVADLLFIPPIVGNIGPDLVSDGLHVLTGELLTLGHKSKRI